ncbi:hypothetical protein P3W45_001718 [Vairimorpha bombi]|jgi:hypothetical protein
MSYDKIQKNKKSDIDYSTFISQDYHSDMQKEVLLNLFYLSKFYKSNYIQRNENSDKIDYKPEYSTKKRYKLHLLKLSVLDNRPYKSSLPLDHSFFNLQNFIFIMAILKNKPDIVYQFLNYGFPRSINSPIFGSDLSPTYYHLACVTSTEMVRLFSEYSPSNSLAWNGLTPQMLLLSKNYFLYDKQEWSFMTTFQYELFSRFNGIFLIKNKENPMFLADLMCINNQVNELDKLLKSNNDLIHQSKFCFVLAHDFEIIKILTKYTLETAQRFCKLTPLHISAYINDMNHAITFLLLKMDLNVQDSNGDSPLHIAARLKHYTMLEFFIRQNGNVNLKNYENISPKDIYEKDNWEMVTPNYSVTDVLLNLADMDYNNKNFECSSVSMPHIMNIKNFKNRSRFKIISLLSFYGKENEALKMMKRLDEIDVYRYKQFKDLSFVFNQHLYKK